MSAGWMENFPDEDLWVTPVEFSNGLMSKYGKGFTDREIELDTFQKHFGVQLPKDFVEYIGEFCEAGFDGWYRVSKLKTEYIVWSHLLLMRLPEKSDSNVSKYVLGNILRQENLFYSNNGKSLRYFPFGSATIFSNRLNHSIDGYLTFDMSEEYAVSFIGVTETRHEYIAKSFNAMIEHSDFIHFG